MAVNKKVVKPVYRPYKNYMRLFIYQPRDNDVPADEPDHPVLQGYLDNLGVETFMTKPAITFSIHMLPGQFILPKKCIKEFNFTDDNDCVIFLKNEDTTVIRRHDQ